MQYLLLLMIIYVFWLPTPKRNFCLPRYRLTTGTLVFSLTFLLRTRQFSTLRYKMYFVNYTDSVVELADKKVDDVLASSGPGPCSSRSSAAPSPPPSFTASDVAGMEMDRLRADELLWAAYERGWKDAYATTLTALATVPVSPLATGSPSPPPADTRASATGPVRRRTRDDRHERFRLVNRNCKKKIIASQRRRRPPPPPPPPPPTPQPPATGTCLNVY